MSGRGYSGVVPIVDPIKKALKTMASFDGSSQIDLFNRLKVSIPSTQFTYQNEYSKGENQWVEKVVGTASATHDPINSAVTLSAVTLSVSAPNSSIIRQTRRYFRYSSGKTLSTLLTFNCLTPPPGAKFGVGYNDNGNGLFLEVRNDGVYVALRRNGVVTYYPRSEWNVDKLDGTGRSGVNYDFTKSTIFGIDLQWLGVGTVLFSIESPTGELLAIHKIYHSGLIEGTYMRTANLPIRYELSTDETFSGSFSAQQICSAVTSEASGDEDTSNYTHSVFSGIASTSVATRRAVLAIRPKALFNTLEGRASITFRDVDLFVASANTFWEVVYNPTYSTVPTWTSVGDYSSVEYSNDVAAFTGGITILSGFIAAGGATRSTLSRAVNTNYPLGLDIDGADPTSIAIVCTPLTGTAAVNASMSWEEIY